MLSVWSARDTRCVSDVKLVAVTRYPSCVRRVFHACVPLRGHQSRHISRSFVKDSNRNERVGFPMSVSVAVCLVLLLFFSLFVCLFVFVCFVGCCWLLFFLAVMGGGSGGGGGDGDVT